VINVQGRCPACHKSSLFLGDGGHVTCSRLDCPNPCAADEMLHGEQPAPGPAATQTTEPCTGQCDPTTGAFTHAVTCYEERERTGRNAGLAHPREHCGHLSPETALTTPRTECVLRPGHTGSHADEVGCRWWPVSEEQP
jgi:hypothetical protein